LKSMTKMEEKRNRKIDAKTIAKIAIFVAVSFILAKIEFAILPAAPFLKLDFSNVFVLIGGFMLGPIAGATILLIKEAFCLIGTSTPIGQLANVIMGLSFILVPTIVYHYKKGISCVIITLLIGTILEIGSALICNRFITFPLFMGSGAEVAFTQSFWWIVLFNVIKCIACSILTILLYKRIKKILKF